MKITNEEGGKLAQLMRRDRDSENADPWIRDQYLKVLHSWGDWGQSFNHYLALKDPFITAYVTAAKLSGEI